MKSKIKANRAGNTNIWETVRGTEEGKPPADDLKIACAGQNGIGDREREDWKGLITFLLQFILCKIRVLHTCNMLHLKGQSLAKLNLGRC